MTRKLFYIFDQRLIRVSRNIPNIGNRASIVQALVFAYNLHSKYEILPGGLATEDDLISFHTREYIECLQKASETADIEKLCDSQEIIEFNLEYDCPLFEGIYEFVKSIVGSTLTAAHKLTEHLNSISITYEKIITNSFIQPKSYLKYDCKSQPVIKESVFDIPHDLSFDESQLEQFKNPEKKIRIKTCRVTEPGSNSQVEGSGPVVVNWFGGWHHAQRDAAEGFCYANDIVIGIQYLMKYFRRILYLDLDVHHGNGVENAFLNSRRVLTLSIHLQETGFYPSSGYLTDRGLGSARYYAVNVPLRAGITDDKYTSVFQQVFTRTVSKFCPDAIVVQCGADCLSGDPLGGFNLTEAALGFALRRVLDTRLPTLVLGGGGYHAANTARCWAYLTSVISDTSIPNDIPDNHYFDVFGPDFTVMITPSLRKDENTHDYISEIVKSVLTNLDHVSPG